MKEGENTEQEAPENKGFFGRLWADYKPANLNEGVALGLLVGACAVASIFTGGAAIPAALSLWGAYKGYKNAKGGLGSKIWGAIKGSFVMSAAAAVGSTVVAIVGTAVAVVGTVAGVTYGGVKAYRAAQAGEEH